MKVETHERGQFKLVRTTESIAEGDLVLDLSDSSIRDTPTQTSIRIGHGRHAEHPVGQFVNHSCEPTCAVMGKYIVALAELPVGTEVTFNYTENEDALASPFSCLECGQTVRGSPAPCKKTV